MPGAQGEQLCAPLMLLVLFKLSGQTQIAVSLPFVDA